MLDFHQAELYETEPKRLKDAVRRNIDRFPPDFMFVLTREEYNSLRTQFATLDKQGRGKYSKYLPYSNHRDVFGQVHRGEEMRRSHMKITDALKQTA